MDFVPYMLFMTREEWEYGFCWDALCELPHWFEVEDERVMGRYEITPISAYQALSLVILQGY